MILLVVDAAYLVDVRQNMPTGLHIPPSSIDASCEGDRYSSTHSASLQRPRPDPTGWKEWRRLLSIVDRP